MEKVYKALSKFVEVAHEINQGIITDDKTAHDYLHSANIEMTMALSEMKNKELNQHGIEYKEEAKKMGEEKETININD